MKIKVSEENTVLSAVDDVAPKTLYPFTHQDAPSR